MTDPGKIRSFQRVTTADGFFLICALDHLSDFQALLDLNPASVDHRRTVSAKIELIRALAPQVSAFLLDAEFGLAQAIAARAVPGSVGLMASIENEDYQIPRGARRTRLREGWSARQTKLIGADVIKLLWFFRPDADTADHQRSVVRSLVNECAGLSLPLVVEPIWYPLPGEDPASTTWQRRRVDGIIESAAEAAALGVDMLKVEFPGSVDSEQERSAAMEACKRLNACTRGLPWVILSAGVGYDAFREQVRIASAAGASGFLAGRSIWRDAAATHDPARRQAAIAEAAARLSELASVSRANGRPYCPALDAEEAALTFPSEWYRHWHSEDEKQVQMAAE
ncbi:MAG: tagatose 1,6-diphosphate aldolase [Acetobacteraceae bacterium]|nr:tagatose 1,6-diphosphate aldolase [Acetobacteraceae bacterium]